MAQARLTRMDVLGMCRFVSKHLAADGTNKKSGTLKTCCEEFIGSFALIRGTLWTPQTGGFESFFLKHCCSHVDRIVDSLVLQLERAAIVDVGADDVHGVGGHLMDGVRVHGRPCSPRMPAPLSCSAISRSVCLSETN